MAGYIAAYLTIPLLAAVADAQTYAVATITSWHFDRDKSYNEKNLGLGLEHRLSDDWSVSAGFFRNSFDRHTNYVFAGYTPLEVMGWRTGVVMGAVTGYEDRPSPWLTGVATRDYGRVGINLVFSAAGIALQLSINSDDI
jgi:hypothetical protein